MKAKQKNGSDGFSLPHPSSSDLRGRQSVRATFRLTEKAIDALSIVSTHLGIKQKSLFDHLIEDMETLSRIARRLRFDEFERPERVQKTYVLSRRTLSCLERVSREFDASRDALVEYSIKRLLPLIAQEQQKHGERKDILGDLTAYVEEGKRILEKTRNALGEDDPVYGKIEDALRVLDNARGDIESLIEKGKLIEEFRREGWGPV